MFDATVLLFILFVLFLFVALIMKEAYVFAMSAFFSIILGIQLATSFSSSSSGWAFSIIGFALILFGFWLLLPAYKIALEDKTAGKTKN
jgi:hypothetical protein